MNYPIEYILFGASLLLLLSIIASKVASIIRVPALIIFILVGMAAGSEGPGGIEFDDAWVAQFLGVIALAFIIFSGGLHSSWKSVSPVLWTGVSLSTIGVFLTAILVGLFVYYLLDFSILMALLLGAIVSSTDAAAVFSVMSSSGTKLKGSLKDLLEFESASNDPMAVILTLGFIHLITNPEASIWSMVLLLIQQMVLGIVIGLIMGKAIVFTVNRLRLNFEGLYPVLTLALVIFTYGLTASIGGSGFLAVYIAGLILGGSDFIHKQSLTRFHDGLAWLMQITMFLILGLLVFPSRLFPIIVSGILISLFLIIIARPIGVFISLPFGKNSLKEKTFISWVGLRGAVPIILATFPLLAGVPKADILFNIVFFIVITSVLIQGTTIALAAKLLGVNAPETKTKTEHVEFEFHYDENSQKIELVIPQNSEAIGKQLVELGLPESAIIILIKREDKSIVPRGGTIIEPQDKLLILAENDDLPKIKSIFGI
ncbi:MAG: potassium/proton antiporter [Thermodesulfobacteriales bacterium]|nr:MAG: potassium/proton antiporter [Thermodesulfobacteriales bacterium]